MRRFIPYLLLVVLAFAVQGCESTAVSRSFHADFDRTWDASLRASGKLTGRHPATMNREKGRIVTVWVNRNAENFGSGTPVTGRQMEIWRGVITLEGSGGWTKVSVRLEKGNVQTSEHNSDPNRREGSIGVQLSPEKDDLQRRFLDEIESELNRDHGHSNRDDHHPDRDDHHGEDSHSFHGEKH